jgi:ssDNA-binding Zn-finger/Zn-ribbon topoisomerase 1
MVIELPAYSGPSVKCPECGLSYVVATEHHASGAFIGEHLCRICRICGWSWAEACVSKSDDESSKPCQTTT